MALVAPHTTVMTIEQVGRGRMRCGGVYQYYTSQVSSLHRLLQLLDPTPSCISSCTHHLLLYAIFLVKNQKCISTNWNVSRWWAEARNYQCIHIYVIMIHVLAQEFVFPLYHCIGNRSYHSTNKQNCWHVGSTTIFRAQKTILGLFSRFYPFPIFSAILVLNRHVN